MLSFFRRRRTSQNLRQRSRWKLWLFRCSAAALGLLLIVLVEAGLRLSGAGHATGLVVPVEPKPEALPFRLNEYVDTAYYGTVPLQGPETRRFAFPRTKNTYRVLVVGASTVLGFPHPPELAFPRHLEVLLNRQSLGLDFEVLNAGITAINSTCVADLVRQAPATDPDLIVVHCGHNEFYSPGGQAASTGAVSSAVYPWLMSVRRMRLAQLMQQAMADEQAGTDLQQRLPGVLEIPLDSPLVREAEATYRANLRRMKRRARSAGISILFTTVASNLRDQSPIRSIAPEGPSVDREKWNKLLREAERHLDDERYERALAVLDAANALYAGSARAAFRRAQALEGLGRRQEARKAYRRARDLDGCRFRAPASFRRIVREVAAEIDRNEVYFADTAAELQRAAGERAPGARLFLEHVHYTCEGHWQLARILARQIVTDVLGRQWSGDRVPDDDERDRLLGYLAEDGLAARSNALQIIGTPPLNDSLDAAAHRDALIEQIRAAYLRLSPAERRAFERLSMEQMARDLPAALGRLHQSRGRHRKALTYLEKNRLRRPWRAESHVLPARSLRKLGRRKEARESLERALALQPDHAEARELLREMD